MIPVQKPDAILFDWDNTLADNWHSVLAAFNHTLKSFGHDEWGYEESLKNAKRSAKETFSDLFGKENAEKAGSIFYDHFTQNHLNGLTEMPDAYALLSAIKQAGIPMGVVSNKRGDPLRKEIDYLGWDHFFDVVLGADDAEKSKPDPAPILKALNILNLPPTDVWFVGDTESDVRASLDAGCVSIFIHTDKMKNMDLKFLNGEIIIQMNGINDLYCYFDKLNLIKNDAVHQ